MLNSHRVDYLVIGGYAVAFHGYPRATADMDVWVAVNEANAARLVASLREFGFDLSELSPALFLQPDRMIRMGSPPMRIEIATGISGVRFDECFSERVVADFDALPVSLIGLEQLRMNERAAGRHKDLDDLEHLS